MYNAMTDRSFLGARSCATEPWRGNNDALSDTLAQIVAHAGFIARTKGAQLTWDFKEPLPSVAIDQVRLRRALVALVLEKVHTYRSVVINAEHSPEDNGRVCVYLVFGVPRWPISRYMLHGSLYVALDVLVRESDGQLIVSETIDNALMVKISLPVQY